MLSLALLEAEILVVKFLHCEIEYSFSTHTKFGRKHDQICKNILIEI